MTDRLTNRLVETYLAGGETTKKLGKRVVTCPEHGDYESTGAIYLGVKEIWTKCPACVQIEKARAAAEEAAIATANNRARVERMLQQTCIPAKFIGRSFDNYVATTPEQRHALSVCREYAERFNVHAKRGSSLIMLGNRGTGKSHLTAAILQSILPQHLGMYVTLMDIIRSVRGSWRRDSEMGESEVMQQYQRVDLLAIDEVGVQYDTDGEKTILFDVLDRRYREMKPTILMGNVNMAGLKECLGDRIHSRLTEVGRVVLFEWGSYRSTARKEGDSPWKS